MKPRLTLDALEVIDAIDRKGSYAAAAAVLNRVPSAVSYTVQKLEQDLGVTLFRKEGRRAVLTAAGKHLVEQGRHLLSAADELALGPRLEQPLGHRHRHTRRHHLTARPPGPEERPNVEEPDSPADPLRPHSPATKNHPPSTSAPNPKISAGGSGISPLPDDPGLP